MANTTETPIINGIGHIALNVGDMEKTLEFYCGVLGLKHAFTLRNADGVPWIEYIKVADNNFIELFYARNKNAAAPEQATVSAVNPTFHHICLTVGDIRAAEKAIDGAGWTVDTRPKQGSDKNWQMWVRDPDGNKLELMQISPESPQANS